MGRINRFSPIAFNVAWVDVVKYPSRIDVVPNKADDACATSMLFRMEVLYYVVVDRSVFAI